MCRVCKHPKGVLKPDIVFFGEDLSDEFHEKMAEDRDMVYFLSVSEVVEINLWIVDVWTVLCFQVQ